MIDLNPSPVPALPGAVPGSPRRVRRALLAPWVLAATLVCPPPLARADDDDASRARAALQAGEIAPLAKVLDAVQAQWKGQVIAVELDHEDEGWVYEVKLLGSRGSVIKLDYDARSMRLLKARGSGVDEARRAP